MSILTQADSNAIIEQQLDEKIALLEDVLDADVLTFSGAIVYGTDTLIRDHIEKIDPKRETRRAHPTRPSATARNALAPPLD